MTVFPQMHHAPSDYVCPICLGIQNIQNKHTLLLPQDLVYKNGLVSAFINSFFIEGSEGHIIIVPNAHVENLYDLNDAQAEAVLVAAKQIARAMKLAYACDGITLLQNNEPAGDQHAFHFHLHVFPRYENDQFHTKVLKKRTAEPKERKEFAEKIRNAIF